MVDLSPGVINEETYFIGRIVRPKPHPSIEIRHKDPIQVLMWMKDVLEDYSLVKSINFSEMLVTGHSTVYDSGKEFKLMMMFVYENAPGDERLISHTPIFTRVER